MSFQTSDVALCSVRYVLVLLRIAAWKALSEVYCALGGVVGAEMLEPVMVEVRV